jgi:hypothetical protein
LSNIGSCKNPERLGTNGINCQGLHFVVVEYKNATNISVQFDDGTIVSGREWKEVGKQSIRNPNYRIGERRKNSQNLYMEIIRYRNASDMDIKFDDGYIACNKSYDSFVKGKVNNPNYKYASVIDRTNEINVNKQGCKMKIIRYSNVHDIDVEFSDGTIETHRGYRDFKSGSIINRNIPSVCGVGFIGTGEYDSSNSHDAYRLWLGILGRCYTENTHKSKSYFGKCTVCDEWKNFQNFAKWYNENWYCVDNEPMSIDKDILRPKNTVYSPDNCIIIPMSINLLFVRSYDKLNRDLPMGVYKWGNKYEARYKNTVGVFETPEEAHSAYIFAKRANINSVIEGYKNRLPEKVYNALCNYNIE